MLKPAVVTTTLRPNWTRFLSSALITMAVLWHPTLSLAQTDQTEHTQTTKVFTKKHVATRQQPYSHRHLYGWNQPSSAGGCTSLNNLFPPCMSSWPEGSPHYHGYRSGPTFFDEQ